MRIPANSVSEYISKVPEDRRESFEKILEILRNNLPEGFRNASAMECPRLQFRTACTPTAIIVNLKNRCLLSR